MTSDTRLERALEVFLDSKARGVPRRDVLAAHPDLAELLDLLFDGAADDAECRIADDGERDGGGRVQEFGDYRIRREIGRGGMGTVFEASQRSLGRRVALKVLNEGVAGSATQVARFRREALTLARLDHPNIVGILDVGFTAGRHWLAMDYVDGQSLDQRLQDLREAGGHAGASLREMVETIASIAVALQHVHEAGVLHRDVKPSNVLLRRDGHALLSDFGLARDGSAPTMTQAGVIAGTPHYMSPEHLVGGDALTPASDVFSLGATLYECITLRRAFAGVGNEVVLQQIVAHDPPDPRRLHPGLHADLAAIALKAVEKDPARRYRTATAFAADLRAFLELRPVEARVPSSFQRMRRWARREPWRAAFAAVLLAVAGTGVWFLVRLPEMQAAEAALTEQEYAQSFARGWAERTGGHRDPSLAAFRRALHLRPRSSEAIAGLCMAIRQFNGAPVAFAELDRLAANADDPELLRRARVLMLQAAGQIDEAAAIHRGLPPPRTPMALWFEATWRFADEPGDPVVVRAALEQISLAVRLSPTPILTLVVQWTIVAFRAGDAAALRECEQALLQRWPDHPSALHYVALAVSGSDRERAVRLCREARARGMEPAESLWLEVSLLSGTDRNEELVATAREALAHVRDDARRGRLIDLLREQQDEVGEAAAIEAWLRVAPDNPEAMSRMGKLRSMRDDHEGAIELLAAVVAQRPDDGEARYNLAVAEHVAGRDGDARASLAAAIAMLPDRERPHRRLLDLLAEPGDAAAILAEHRRWAAIRPADPAAQFALARALLSARPVAAAEAMTAIVAADYLAAGQDPDILECRAAAHEAFGEGESARRCRAAAAVLRAAPRPVVPAVK